MAGGCAICTKPESTSGTNSLICLNEHLGNLGIVLILGSGVATIRAGCIDLQRAGGIELLAFILDTENRIAHFSTWMG